MRQVEFHPEARAEYFASISYYDHESTGLGAEFLQEVENAIELILSFPSAWPIMGGDVRRCMLGRFPYGIIYSAFDDRILIIAAAHC